MISSEDADLRPRIYCPVYAQSPAFSRTPPAPLPYPIARPVYAHTSAYRHHQPLSNTIRRHQPLKSTQTTADDNR